MRASQQNVSCTGGAWECSAGGVLQRGARPPSPTALQFLGHPGELALVAALSSSAFCFSQAAVYCPTHNKMVRYYEPCAATHTNRHNNEYQLQLEPASLLSAAQELSIVESAVRDPDRLQVGCCSACAPPPPAPPLGCRGTRHA